MSKHVDVFKSLLLLSIAILVVSLTYALFKSPLIKKPENRPTPEEELYDLKERVSRANWYWEYDSRIGVEGYYPVVFMRSGFKPLKAGLAESVIGWQYDLVNVSSANYEVTVDYTLTDPDGFHIGTGSVKEWCRAGQLCGLQSKVSIANDDLERLSGSTWKVSLSPSFNNQKGSEDNRFELAAEKLKDSAPMWLRSFIHYRFTGDQIQESDEKWYPFVTTLKVSKNERLVKLLAELDMSYWDIPPKKILESRSDYQALESLERLLVDVFLLESEKFSKYDPETGFEYVRPIVPN